jgi:YesN/AraC family two-component response regulator
MFLLAMVFTTLFTGVAEKLIVEDYQSSLKMIGTYYRQLRFNAVPIIDDLFDEKEIQDYLFNKESKDKASLGSLEKLENAVARNSYVHSIYIYNDEYGFLSSLSGRENPNQLSDSTLMSFLNQRPRNQRLYQRQSVFTSEYIVFSEEENLEELTNLYTICNNRYDDKGKLKYGIIMNLSETMARDLFAEDNDTTVKNFYMLDEQLNFISHPDKKMFGTTVQDNPLLDEVSRYASTAGAIRTKNSAGEEFLACWFDLSEMNWRLIYLLPMSYLQKPLARLRFDLVLVFLGVLVLANLALIWESKRVNRQLSRDNRLVNYLKGSIDNTSFVFEPSNLFSMAIFHVQEYSFEQNPSTVNLENEKLFLFIAKYLNIALDNKTSFLLNTEKDTFVYLNGKLDENLASKLKKLKIDVSDTFGIPLSILYTEEPVAFDNLPEFFGEIKDRLFSATLEATGFVRAYTKLESKDINFFLSEVSEIETSLVQKSLEDYTKAINIMLANLRDQQNYELFCSMKNYLSYSIVGICNELFKASELLDKDEWKNEMLDCRNYEEMKACLLKISTLITEYKDNSSSKHQFELVETMKAVIEESLFDINLSSTFIADKANLSLGYARNLFKAQVGVSLNDYFGKLRIEESCRLLSITNESINEIREKIGFSNTSYFCTYFKKMKGVSPSAYRQKTRLPL